MSAGLSAAAIGGIAAGVGAVGGAAISAMGANAAANTQAGAINNQIGEQNYEFNTVQGLLQPFQQAGTNALPGYQNAQANYAGQLAKYSDIVDQLNNLTGANGGTAQQSAVNGLTQLPLYTNSMNLGQQAILANASATGGLRGGNTIATLGYLPGQILSNVMQQQIGNLGTSLNGTSGLLQGTGNQISQFGNLINLGENAAARTGQAAMSTGNNITSLMGQGGAIGAGSILAGTNAITGGINGLTGALGTYLNNRPGANASSYMSAAGMNPDYQSAYSGFDNPANYG